MCLVVTPVVKDDEREKLLKEIKEDVEKFKGKVVKTDDWGKKTLAFRMKKESEGYYFLLNLEFEDEAVNELSRKLRMNDKILRFLLVKLEK